MGGEEHFCAAEMTNNTYVASGDGEDILPPEKTVVVDDDRSPLTMPAPLLSSHNNMKHMMRPLFDAVHTLGCMNVIEELERNQGIAFPTIVVIGDPSSGKSSLIESLTGIGLPRGNLISACISLIMKFQHHSDPVSELRLEYKGKSRLVDENDASACISRLMGSLTREGNEITYVPFTLIVKKNNVPDITILDLSRIFIQGGQLENIFDILAAHVKLEDCVVLHVISATADFRTCESNKIIKKFDEYGDKTLHVFTKFDKGSGDMVAIVTTNYMEPDYVCVRNRLGDETQEEARAKEVSLFKTHHLLSKIDKSMVGVPVVAQRLFKLQLEGIIKCLCGLVWFINKDLNTCVVQHNRLLQQHNFTTISEAMPAFVQIISEAQKSLRKLVCNEFDEFPDETQMEYCRTRLREMTSELSQQLAKHDEEARALEAKKWSLEQAFQFLFERKIADMSKITSMFVSRVWDYIGFVIIKVLELHAQKSYPQLFLALKKAATKVIATQKESFRSRLLELLDMKKMRVYMHDVGDIYTWNDMKKKMVDCTELVRKNFFLSADLDLPNMVLTIVAPELEPKMVNELKNDGENRYKPMLKESPSMTTRKGKLKSRIELLQTLKKVVENAMDEISLL